MPIMPADWEARYQEGDTPWDLGKPAPVFSRLIHEARFAPGKLLIPGAGRGYDAIAFAQAGFDVTSVDVSESACAFLRELAASQGAAVDVRQEDFFAMSEVGTYDLALEYTFYCAIDPSLRTAYRDQMARLLKPGGLLFGLFFPLTKPLDAGGPPFGVRRDEVEASLSECFDLVMAEEPADSVKPRRGNEILMIWRRR
ncbi:tellurite resistance protein TehB [compost metagenome]